MPLLPFMDDALSEDDRRKDLLARLLAAHSNLPRICARKICRRRRRCWGVDLACLHHHDALIAERSQRYEAREAARQRRGGRSV